MARITGLTAVFLALLEITAASPTVAARQDTNTTGTCTQKAQRKAWHKLTDDEKAAYIEAEKCIMASPPKSGIELAENRWDELVYIHIIQSNFVHDVGQFLPWHRYYMKVHETVLQTECNYTGYQPYWDEQRDADNSSDIAYASVLDPDTGFGGEGDDCVNDGPFANTTLRLTANWGVVSSSEYCLSRSFNNKVWMNANSTNTDPCLESENYTVAADCFPSNPHTAGHGGIGGTLLDVAASPGDPLFFLHHTNLDRLWWKWQQADPENRTYDIGLVQNTPSESYLLQNNYTFPDLLYKYSGDVGNYTTLNHTIWMVDIMPNVTVGDVMDLGGDTICAEYIEDED